MFKLGAHGFYPSSVPGISKDAAIAVAAVEKDPLPESLSQHIM